VMITGAEPLDEGIFSPHANPGVYQAPIDGHAVLGVVEMDGLQYRYQKVKSTKEHIQEGPTPLEVVTQRPSSFFYDRGAGLLYIHTSDGQAPDTHEIELMHRGNGIYVTDRHYITVVGFTFRHMGDAGINFFKGSGDGVAIGNTSYGSRQGIRVYDATSVVAYGNVLFRNENCGIYFAAESTHGLAIANVAYENIKGLRWSSQSEGGMAIDNVLFDNHERGVAIESVERILVRGNRLVNNTKSQLMVMRAQYNSDENCFQNGAPEQLTADFVFTERYGALVDYQRARSQDLSSREGACGPLPEKLDVQKLHAETTAYTERARAMLREASEAQVEAAGTSQP
jgi:hypothetical protein